MTDWPTAGDYAKALQVPDKAFVSLPLQRAQIATDPVRHMPRTVPGSTAAVFKAEVGGRTEALRMFTRDAGASREQYSLLQKHFTTKGLTDCVAMGTWEDNAITVNGRPRPVVRMEWVEGSRLDRYVDSLVRDGNRDALVALAANWRRLVKRLQDAEFAHGDLQHGNVLVDQTGSLRLVDFDGAWIPPFANRPVPPERGHPNYQRRSPRWDRHMDTFPALVIYVCLVAVSKDQSPWDEFYDEGENLLFEDRDFVSPGQTEIWKALHKIGDRDVKRLVGQLQSCCQPDWPASDVLEKALIPRWWDAPQTVPLPSTTLMPLPPPPPPAPTRPIGTLPSVPKPRRSTPWYDRPLTPLPTARPVSRVPPAEHRRFPVQPRPTPRPTPPRARPAVPPSPPKPPAPAAKPRKTGANVLFALLAGLIVTALTVTGLHSGALVAGLIVAAVVLGLLAVFRN